MNDLVTTKVSGLNFAERFFSRLSWSGESDQFYCGILSFNLNVMMSHSCG